MSNPKRSMASLLVDLVEENAAMLFKDQYQQPFAILPEQTCYGFNLRSTDFRRWLARLAWQNLAKAPSGEALNSAIAVLEGKALYESARIDLHVRLGWFDSKIYYDMGCGYVVEISSAGWTVEQTSPIWFRPLRHQKRQVNPTRGGNPRDILQFVNLSDESKASGRDLLVLIWIITSMIPGFPHPVLVAHGPHGSSKSTFFRMVKTIIDPSEISKMAPAQSITDFVVTSSRHWFIPLDNLSGISEWMSDAICRACTGDGFSKRELYTDSDEIVVSYQRIIGINGINLVVDKPDLLDRSLLMELKPLTKGDRRSELELWREFNERLPSILGGIFDVLSKALGEIENVHLSEMPRMADFTRWGVAVARAMGFKDSDFLDAYYENIQDQHEEAVDFSPVARVVLEFMHDKSAWEATPSELLADLNRIAERLKVDTKSKFWPKESNWLWRRLNISKNNLEAMGLSIERRGKGPCRVISMRKLGLNGVNAVNSDLFPGNTA